MSDTNIQNSISKHELINHLSNEIATATQAMTSFRSKANITMFYGPFVVLGAYVLLVKDKPEFFFSKWYEWVLLIIMSGCWLYMGKLSAKIEKHSWEKCNKWRECIYKLQYSESYTLTKEELVFDHSLEKSYMGVYSLQLVIFICTFIIIIMTNSTRTFDKEKKQTPKPLNFIPSVYKHN